MTQENQVPTISCGGFRSLNLSKNIGPQHQNSIERIASQEDKNQGKGIKAISTHPLKPRILVIHQGYQYAFRGFKSP